MPKKTTAELVSEKPSLAEFYQLPKTPVTVVADNVRSLDNVGLLFRLCDGFRVQRIILCGITGYPEGRPDDPRPVHIRERHDRRIGKTAIGTVPFVPWECRERSDDFVRERQDAGDMIVVLEQTHDSVPYRDVMYRFPLVLVVGHERAGVDDAVLSRADAVADIPMDGMGNSHNVAIATAIVLAHLRGLLPTLSV